MIIDFLTKRRNKSLNNVPTFERNTKIEHDTTLSSAYTRLDIMENPSFFTPVETPVLVDKGDGPTAVEGRKAIINPDNGEVLSIVSDRYRLITNEEVFSAFDTALSESNIDLTGAYKSVYVCGKGGKTYLNYSFPAYETTITDRVVGDTVRLSCGAVNGYDGNTMFSTTFDSYRLICKNSMVTASPISYFAGKHTQNLLLEQAVEKIKRAIDVYCDHAGMYRRWADTPINGEDALKLLEKLSIKTGSKTEINEKLFEQYKQQWSAESQLLGSNRWALYNTMTHISSHRDVRTRGNNMNAQKTAQLNREQDLRKFLGKNTAWFSEAA